MDSELASVAAVAGIGAVTFVVAGVVVGVLLRRLTGWLKEGRRVGAGTR